MHSMVSVFLKHLIHRLVFIPPHFPLLNRPTCSISHLVCLSSGGHILRVSSICSQLGVDYLSGEMGGVHVGDAGEEV